MEAVFGWRWVNSGSLGDGSPPAGSRDGSMAHRGTVAQHGKTSNKMDYRIMPGDKTSEIEMSSVYGGKQKEMVQT